MKKLGTVLEDEVIAIFLQSELTSKRWGGKLKELLAKDDKPDSIVASPDLASDSENEYRRDLIGRFRGYGENRELFEDFPKDVNWFRYLLSQDELAKVKYIDYSYWNKLTDGTRVPKVAAENVRKGTVIFDQPNHNFLEAAKRLKDGKKFPTMIFVGKDEESDLVILEGHLRMTAYYLNPQTIPKQLEVVIGFSEEFAQWGLY